MKKRSLSLMMVLTFASTILFAAGCGAAAPSGTPTETPAAPSPSPTASASTPAEGSWAVGFTHTFEPGFWPLGGHRYGFRANCPAIDYELASDWQVFTVSDEVPPRSEPVYLRLRGLSLERFAAAYASDASIHPDQETIAALWIVGLSEEEAGQAVASCDVILGWDEGSTQQLTAEEPFQP